VVEKVDVDQDAEASRKEMIQTSKGRRISRKNFQTERKYLFSSRNLKIRKSLK